jgi:hypothetical protein
VRARLRGSAQGCASSADHSGTVLIRRLLAIPATLLALAGIAAPAQAVTQQQVDTYKGLAQQTWPSSQCYGRENIKLVDYAADGWASAMAWVDGCRVEIDARPDMSDADLCKMLVHELGHLARGDRHNEHSDDPTNIMWPAPASIAYAPCDSPSSLPAAYVAPAPQAVAASAAAIKTLRKRCRTRQRFMWGRCRS